MLTLSIDQNNRTCNGTYMFSSQPRVVQQRNKLREQHYNAEVTHHLPYSNLISDKRNARGNAFVNSRNSESAYQSFFEARKSNSSFKKQLRLKSSKRNAWESNTPEPVEGRQHIKIQTELYLEELNGVVEEMDVCCQTDPFLDRPPTPFFIPAKIGIDRGTQIYEGDIFDFDLEVKPILEVLVGKVTEQALIEVMEEEELTSLRERQRIFEGIREAELQEQQRLEEEDRRRREEKLFRMKQQQEKIKQDKETAEKIAAKIYAQQLLTDLIPSVFASLTENGFFHDPVEREIETIFFPKLLRNVRRNLNNRMTARRLLDGLIMESVIKRRRMSRESKDGDMFIGSEDFEENISDKDNVQVEISDAPVLELSPEGKMDETENDNKEVAMSSAEINIMAED